MFQQPRELLCRKRGRERDVELGPQGFEEHRAKRHMASLPLRRSPEHKRRSAPTFQADSIPLQSPTVADITPVASDSEDVPPANKPCNSFSSWSSPIGYAPQGSQTSSEACPDGSQSIQTQESVAYSDDLEMTDSGLLYPNSFQPDPSAGIAGRIPTPIHSQFASYIRTVDKAPSHYGQGIQSPSNNYNYIEPAAPTMPYHGRRLPSPISEDEASSPGLLPHSLVDIQMDVEDASGPLISDPLASEETRSTPKKGHTRSKHSLRNWGGIGPGPDNGGLGVRKGFSMGYRSDCEKCRMRVPGHFSHVITY